MALTGAGCRSGVSAGALDNWTDTVFSSLTPELEAVLAHPVVEQDVAPSTQNQALQAISFLYREVLEQPILGDINALRSREHRRLPTVLTPNEVRAMLNQLTGVYHLCTALLYGSGLRVNECLPLRVKDIDLDHCEIIVRSGKGDQDRVTMQPESIVTELRAHLQMVQAPHQRDLALGQGRASLPHALAAKYPNAS